MKVLLFFMNLESMLITLEELEVILHDADLSGFTAPIKGSCRRYIVWLTHNVVWSVDLLKFQLEYYSKNFDQVSIGGRTDPNTGDVVIDVSTSVESLKIAKLIGVRYNQQEIYDSCDSKCISLNMQ